MQQAKNTFNSGDVGTTGREPFETPYGDNTQQNTGAGTGAGVGSGASQPTTGHYGSTGQPGEVGVVGGHGHGHSHDHEHLGDNCTHSSHSTGHSHASTLNGSHGSHGNTGTDAYGSRGGNNDLTGNLNQGAAQYESTGRGGPTTGGAAGTDRFDSDRSGSATHGGNLGGAPVDDTYAEGRKQNSGLEAVKSAFTTSDKEFTNRDRKGPASGAYTDTDGAFQKNTSGPDGNSALTGREGNFERNPVSGEAGQGVVTDNGTGVGRTKVGHGGHSKIENVSNDGTPSDIHGAGHTSSTGHAEGTQKEGLMDKIKHAVGK